MENMAYDFLGTDAYRDCFNHDRDRCLNCNIHVMAKKLALYEGIGLDPVELANCMELLTQYEEVGMTPEAIKDLRESFYEVEKMNQELYARLSEWTELGITPKQIRKLIYPTFTPILNDAYEVKERECK